MLGQQYSSAPYSSVHLGISDEPEGGGNCLSGIFGFGPYGSIICNEDTGGVVVDVGSGGAAAGGTTSGVEAPGVGIAIAMGHRADITFPGSDGAIRGFMVNVGSLMNR